MSAENNSIDKIKILLASPQPINNAQSTASAAVENNASIFNPNSPTTYTYLSDTQLDPAIWEIPEPTSEKALGFLWKNGVYNYTFTSKDGTVSTIKTKDTENLIVARNKETNEIVIIGGNVESINLGKGDDVTLINANAKEIIADEDDATIKVEGAKSNVAKIIGKDGSQEVIVSHGAKVELIKTGDGDDSIIVSNAAAGKIVSGKGDDALILNNATVSGNINTEKGDDYVLINESSLNGELIAGVGSDVIRVNETTLNGDIDLGGSDKEKNVFHASNTDINANMEVFFGDADITLDSSTTLAEDKKIRTGYGTYNVTIEDSNLDGTLVAGGYNDNADYQKYTLTLQDSSISNVLGLRDDETTTITSINSSMQGAEKVTNTKIEYQSLDTSVGAPYENYTIVKPSAEGARKTYTLRVSNTETITVSEEDYKNNDYGNFEVLSENVQNCYNLKDGTQIWMNQGGEVYTGPDGKLVINSADKVEIIGSSNNGKSSAITVLNSNVISHKNVVGNVVYENSRVDAISVSDESDVEITFKENSRVAQIDSSESNLKINLTDTSKIDNIASFGAGLIEINATGGEIANLTTEQATISGIIKKAKIGTVKTKNGTISLFAEKTTFGTIENKGKNGATTLEFSEVVLDKIVSNSFSDISLNSCQVTSKIKTSESADILNIINTIADEIDTQNGGDDVFISEGSIQKLHAIVGAKVSLNSTDIEKAEVYGDLAVFKADIDNLITSGNLSIQASDIEKLNVGGVGSNIRIKDSLIGSQISMNDDNLDIDNFGNIQSKGVLDDAQMNIADEMLTEMTLAYNQEIESLLGEYSEQDYTQAFSAYNYLNLTDSERQNILTLAQTEPNNPTVVTYFLVNEMQNALLTQENAIINDAKSVGLFWKKYGADTRIIEAGIADINTKRKMISDAITTGDIESLLNIHSILTDEISGAIAYTNHKNAVEYASSLTNEQIGNVLNNMLYIGNAMEYSITEQDGIIKNVIAYGNMVFDIGTNRKEVEAHVATYKADVNALVEKYEEGTLTPEELASEYKRITGYSFTQENVQTLTDNDRNNNQFDNNAEDKITDYQNTQQQIFQVGEMVVTIVAGTAVSVATGGAFGPAVAGALSSLGAMGVALTSTSVSFVTKTVVDLMERQTNGVIADDVTSEEIAKSAALMYAGCFCGQLGNAVSKYFKTAAPEFFSKFISSDEMVEFLSGATSNLLGFGADTTASYLTTAMITGSGDINQEFIENLRSELIGLIQSKITNSYFAAHPEIIVKNEIYNIKKEAGAVSEAEATAKVLEHFGIKGIDPKGLSESDLELIVTLKQAGDLCDTSLKDHGFDPSQLSLEQKFDYNKLLEDLYTNVERISQQTDNTCAVVSVLNGISNKPILIQALAQNIKFDASNNTYKFNIYGEEFIVEYKQGDNILQKAYEAYQAHYGDSETTAIDVFNGLLQDASDIVVRPNADNIAQLRKYVEDDASVLTFNTEADIDGISKNHAYTVLGIDDSGNIRLQDPETLEEITVSKSQYEGKDCQIEGKTYKDSGLIQDGVDARLVAGNNADKLGHYLYLKNLFNVDDLDNIPPEYISLKDELVSVYWQTSGRLTCDSNIIIRNPNNSINIEQTLESVRKLNQVITKIKEIGYKEADIGRLLARVIGGDGNSPTLTQQRLKTLEDFGDKLPDFLILMGIQSDGNKISFGDPNKPRQCDQKARQLMIQLDAVPYLKNYGIDNDFIIGNAQHCSVMLDKLNHVLKFNSFNDQGNFNGFHNQEAHFEMIKKADDPLVRIGDTVDVKFELKKYALNPENIQSAGIKKICENMYELTVVSANGTTKTFRYEKIMLQNGLCVLKAPNFYSTDNKSMYNSIMSDVDSNGLTQIDGARFEQVKRYFANPNDVKEVTASKIDQNVDDIYVLTATMSDGSTESIEFKKVANVVNGDYTITPTNGTRTPMDITKGTIGEETLIKIFQRFYSLNPTQDAAGLSLDVNGQNKYQQYNSFDNMDNLIVVEYGGNKYLFSFSSGGNAPYVCNTFFPVSNDYFERMKIACGGSINVISLDE